MLVGVAAETMVANARLLNRAESQIRKCDIRRRTTDAVVPIYVSVSAVLWAVYFAVRCIVVDKAGVHVSSTPTIVASTLAVFSVVLFVGHRCLRCHLSRRICRRLHAKWHRPFTSAALPAIAVTAIACVIVVASFADCNSLMLDAVKFAWMTEALIVVYVCLQHLSSGSAAEAVPFWIRAIFAVCVSIVVEILAIAVGCNEKNSEASSNVLVIRRLIGRVLLHVAIHLLAAGVGLTMACRQTASESRRRSSADALRLEAEHQQAAMGIVRSLMPLKMADLVIRQRSRFHSGGYNSSFHWFAMERVDDVSVLFADIVGFTDMCREKQPDVVVSLLNDIYGRFDFVCQRNGVEPIGTLGDCYYCVAGYPDSAEDHAVRAIETGLDMCHEIVSFREANREHDLDMRIGVHTGRALCGVFGGRRFRFDVFSNDVTIANAMETTGRPGAVHVTQATYELVDESRYVVEEGPSYRAEELVGNSQLAMNDSRQIRTWFIVGRRPFPNSCNVPAEHSVVDDVSATGNRLMCPNACEESDDSHETTYDDDESISSWFQTRTTVHLERTRHRLQLQPTELNDDGVREQTLFGDCTVFFVFVHLVFTANIIGAPSVSSTEGNTRVPWPELGLCLGASFVTCALVLLIARLARRICVRRQVPWSQLRVGKTLRCLCVAIVGLPSIAVLMYASLVDVLNEDWLFVVIVVALIHYSNFTTVISPTVKSVLATVVAVASVLVVNLRRRGPLLPETLGTNVTRHNLNSTNVSVETFGSPTIAVDNGVDSLRSVLQLFEFSLASLTLVVLLWIVNMQSETSYQAWLESEIDRLEAGKTRLRRGVDRQQTNWLLRSVVPDRIANQILDTGGLLPTGYSRSFPDAGIVFAKITNFDRYFDETFEGGVEWLRWLNELIVCFEERLQNPKYEGRIEKIKTIGSCLMIASGIRDDDDDDGDAVMTASLNDSGHHHHLRSLTELAIDLGIALREFNESIKEFNVAFTMKIGLNCGPVTVGVIGKSRTMFDVWGSTVNVASRMCSTGLDGYLQMSGDARQALGTLGDGIFEFTRREDVYIKGIGLTTTFLIQL